MKLSLGTAAAVSFAAIFLSGCASIVEGTSQEILVNTNPVGASCDFVREGNLVDPVAASGQAAQR